MYLPSFKYKGNLITEGDEYSIKGSDQPYVGKYFLTDTGKYFTGNKPGDGPNQRLVPYIKPVGGVNGTRIERYDLVRQKEIETQLKDTLPVPLYYPKPTSSDYTKGIVKRYFAIDKTTGQILEITTKVYASMKAQKPEYYFPKYELKTLKWSLRDRSTNRINSSVAKLDSYLKDPSQFVR